MLETNVIFNEDCVDGLALRGGVLRPDIDRPAI